VKLEHETTGRDANLTAQYGKQKPRARRRAD
jgi:hypothetical protein